MNSIRINVGDILTIADSNFRIIYISPNVAVLCQTDIKQLNLVSYDFSQILKGIEEKQISLIEDNDTSVVVLENLSEAGRKTYGIKSAIVREISKYYGPTYVELLGYGKKEKVDEIVEKYQIVRSTFWKICRQYLQSGMKESSLLRKKRIYSEVPIGSKKRGPKGVYGISSGCSVDEKVREAFDAGLKYYTSGRAKSYQAAYDKINSEYFSVETFENGVYTRDLLPMHQRPTYRQFTYYCGQRLTEENRDAVKTSKMEQRNAKRLLLSEDANRVEGPGEKVECDAVEVDLSLVSLVNSTQTVGRPIVYAMRDVMTHAIVAVSVAFDNNSLLGLTNLFLNLGDDKVEYCRKYGIELTDPRLWPSNFIPMELYADRGSDFKSDNFGHMCKELGITRHLVSGGTGSMKGMIESWFHQMHSMINTHTEDAGLIEKRYDSLHHKEATLTIDDFTKLVITCILSYNQSHMEGYMPRLAEIQNNVDSTPALLWEHYCKEKGSPRPIGDRTTYLSNLLIKKEAKLNRKGIELNKLRYINYSDRNLLSKMYHQQDKKSPFEVQYDPRDNSRIYYVDSQEKLAIATLNEDEAWMKDLKGHTFKETDDYIKAKIQKDKEAKQRNDQIGASLFGVLEGVVSEAKQAHPTYSETGEMREAREQEKQLISRSNAITDRIDGKLEITEEGEKFTVPAKEEPATIPAEDSGDLTDEEYLEMVANYDDYIYEQKKRKK